MGVKLFFFLTCASMYKSRAFAFAAFKSLSPVVTLCHTPSMTKRHCHLVLRSRLVTSSSLSIRACVVAFLADIF